MGRLHAWGGSESEIADPNDRSKVANLRETNVHCALSFTIFEYDNDELEYFQCFTHKREGSKTTLDSIVQADGGGEEARFYINSSICEEVPWPRHFEVEISILPNPDKAQKLLISQGKKDPVVEKTWG